MSTQLEAAIRTPRDRVLSGSAVLLAGLALATAINFAYSIAVARFLGPTGFGHAAAVYTLLILVSAVTLSFQMLTAKIVAQQESPQAQSVVYQRFHWRGWAAGLLVAALFLSSRHAVADYLNLTGPILIVLLAIGSAFYVPLGTRRGYMQGLCNFRLLALDLVLEGLVRFGGSLLLMLLGFGVAGVIAANAGAIAAAYLFATPRVSATSDLEVPVAFREGLQAAVFFAGQVVINNCDIVLVKHFFPPDSAGLYAAVAMVGRVVFVFCWAIVNSMFPVAARTHSRKSKDYGVLGISLLLVLAICLVFALGAWLAPSRLWAELFGPQFLKAGGGNFSSLMVLYAVAAGVYALAVVIMTYEMSRKIANTGWVQLLVSGAVIGGIYAFHSSLAEVIWVQVAMMVFLLFCVAIPCLISLASSESQAIPTTDPITFQRRVSGDEVIAEFLRNDFQRPEFQEYKGTVAGLVTTPNLADPYENEVRRALLFVRHGSLWRELPEGTEWFEAEIKWSDLRRIRVFPRAQWRKLALGDFTITKVAQRIADVRYRTLASPNFLAKIAKFRDRLARNGAAGAVLLIGQSESGPFTVLDGNHRLVAAMLTSPEAVSQLRFLCGLSPKMTQCCWYQTNVATLLRYGTNLFRNIGYDPEKKLLQLLRRSRPLQSLGYIPKDF